MTDVQADTPRTQWWHIPPHILWPGIVVVLLVMQVALSSASIYFAISDPSQVIEPNYYEKALQWDQQQEAARQSQALGWKYTLDIESAPDVLGFRQLKLTLLNDNGGPVSGATVELTMFHRARAWQRDSVILQEGSNGVYTGSLRIRHDGAWIISITASRGNDRFIEEFDRQINQSDPS